LVGAAPPRPQPVGPSAREAAQLRRSPPATGLARRARASGPGFATPPSEAHLRGSAPPPPALRPDSSAASQPPLYCKPSFSARIKSFARNDFAPKIWICSLCFFSNHFRVPTSPPSSSSSAPPLIASLVASRLRRPQSHCGRPSRSSPNELRNYNWVQFKVQVQIFCVPSPTHKWTGQQEQRRCRKGSGLSSLDAITLILHAVSVDDDGAKEATSEHQSFAKFIAVRCFHN